ncbi:hypothetical protein [uncultured Acinetobacter sp.]|uniref:hypothetical protein n=1 Tax=uncultured Acinetobacter sp. TaxID=165433 RepID=UPI0026303864|nr:hypothetical protein [uncultured Acinetobacter sp.]
MSQRNKKQQAVILDMSMVALETLFTFVLQHDRVIAHQAKKFVDQNVRIKINSYVPYFDFYVEFNQHGVLFDTQAPTQPVDLDIRTTLMDLIKIFVLGNKRSIRAMRIEGDITLKDEFRDLALMFSLPKVLSDWKQWLNEPLENGDVLASKHRINPLLEKIDLQRAKINSLQVEVKQYKNRMRHLQSKQKRLNVLFLGIIVLLLLILLYTQFYL